MSVFKTWLELDLTREARAGRLERAFECDDALQDLAHTIEAGLNAIVVGEPGVGKTALVHELVARTVDGRGARRLKTRRVLQISLRRRLSSLEGRYAIHAEVQTLFDAVRAMRDPPALFIRDLGLISTFDLEDKLAALACSSDVVLIGEGSEESVARLLEYEPSLRHRFGTVHCDEPDLDRAERIVLAWAQRRKTTNFSPDAIEQAVALSHRFLARSKLPRKAIDLLKQASADTEVGMQVDSAAVVGRLCGQFRIPRVLVDPTVRLDLDDLHRSLGRSVVGQQDAVSAVVDTIGVIKSGLTDQRRPLASMLFSGPTGVGKTLVAQTIATRLFGRRDRLVRFNMADYQAESDAGLLFGCPSQYDLSLKRGQLTTRLAGHSLGVLLLDEFEKCHPAVHDRFLQLMDEGEFINGVDEKVSCRSFIIVVTTNAGHAHGEAKAFGFGGGANRRRCLITELAAYFRFELLNRFDRIVEFRTLTKEDARSIVVAELRQIQSRIGLKQLGLTMEVERRAIEFLVARGYDVDCGARFLRRTIEREVTTSLARLLVTGRLPKCERVRIVSRAGKIQACFVTPDVERKVHAQRTRRVAKSRRLRYRPKQSVVRS